MEKKIEIKVSWESKDYWRSYLGYYFSFNFILCLSFTIVLYGLFISFLFLRERIEPAHFADVLITAFSFAVLVGLLLSYSSVKNAKTVGEERCKYIFSDKDVELITKSFSSQIDWTHFLRVDETKNYFILQMKSGQNLLPKRFFKDYEQMRDFKSLLRAKLGEEAYLKKPKEKLGLK